MLTKQERKQVSQYLHTFHPWTGFIAIVGIAGVFVDGLGFIILIPLAYHIWWHYRHIPDSEFDSLLEKDLSLIMERARKVVSLEDDDLVREPIIQYGQRPKKLNDSIHGHRQGKDLQWRYTPINAATVFFTEMELVVYQCAWDVFKGHVVIDSTFRAYYHDIVGLETNVYISPAPEKTWVTVLTEKLRSSHSQTQAQGFRINSTLELILRTKSNTPFTVYLPYTAKLEQKDAVHGINEEVYTIAYSVKKMIDDKKNENSISITS